MRHSTVLFIYHCVHIICFNQNIISHVILFTIIIIYNTCKVSSCPLQFYFISLIQQLFVFTISVLSIIAYLPFTIYFISLIQQLFVFTISVLSIIAYLSNFHYIACSSASSGCAIFKGFLIQGNSSGGFRILEISMEMPENANLKGRIHISISFSLNLAPDREACTQCAI